VSPVNTDPSDPAIKLTEPEDFIQTISKDLGLFYTTGFQEDHKALSNGIFSDDEFMIQATKVLEERLALLDYAVKNYDDGLLFFYFSSTDMQSHMFWWDADTPAPTRPADAARHYFRHIQNLYSKLDAVVGDILRRYGNDAWVMVMSDHGFSRFSRQFNLNAWLRENDYLFPQNATSVFKDVDWDRTRAYGLGINSLYINLKGREIYGTVREGMEKEHLIRELVEKLQQVKDSDGMPVIRTVHRSDTAYSGSALNLAPDLVVGYFRPYRASWSTCLGGMEEDVLSDNDSAWCADHCADVMEVPGSLFSNRPIASETPALIDLAPSILTAFGLPVPSSMEGKTII
jgi:predicted AlkP superfamily phosphohydrolase/phosphomutase